MGTQTFASAGNELVILRKIGADSRRPRAYDCKGERLKTTF
jgi:hypothetical protein